MVVILFLQVNVIVICDSFLATLSNHTVILMYLLLASLTVFVAVSACIAVQLGHYPTWMFFQCFCAMTLFYCAHWQTYVSGWYIDIDLVDLPFIT